MPYFLSDENLEIGKIVSPAEDEMGHLLLSHRVKIGEKVKLQGANKKRFLSEVVKIGKNVLQLKCLIELELPREPQTDLVLYQAVVGEKALDFILQKGTELGLKKIILFNAENSATKLSKEKFLAKKARWQKILIEAAKQSERAIWPELSFVATAEELKKQLSSVPLLYLTDISGDKLLIGAKVKDIGIIVGPEGGFTTDELGEFKAMSNVVVLGLGSILLRAETAALAAIAGIRMLFGY
ncbi:MAG: RsmE family RNA methyltransferase [Candidatus Doudnabacteria bacterium]|jgi:16S rRNA (uracil1498-N3)-methyltransferase